MTELELLDQYAADNCRAYLKADTVAILIRTCPDGNVRIVGPALDPQRVAQMLRTAATAYVRTLSN